MYWCEEEKMFMRVKRRRCLFTRRGEVSLTERNWDGMDLIMEKNVEITLD